MKRLLLILLCLPMIGFGQEQINFNSEESVREYLDNNAKGIYFLEIETDYGIINKKLILQ